MLRSFVTARAHRLAVVDDTAARRLLGIISQSDVVRHLHAHPDLLTGIATLPCAAYFAGLSSGSGSSSSSSSGSGSGSSSSSGPSAARVTTVPQDATAFFALQALVAAQVSGAPVVDDHGAVVANFSASDVRLLAGAANAADAGASLDLPVLRFLADRGPKGVHDLAPSALSPVVLQQGDSVAVAVQLLATSRLHHVYVVDAARKPLAVVSLSDVVRALAWALDP